MLTFILALVLTLATTLQAAAGCPPADAQSIAQDPTVAAAFDQAWRDSLEGTPGEHEEGGWIYRCQGVDISNPSAWITVVDHWPRGVRDHVDPSNLSENRDCELVGDFHTHPGPPSEHPNNDGFVNEVPSTEDVQGAEELGVPEFIIFGEGPDPEGTTVVPYGPPEPKKTPCTPNPSPGGGPGSDGGPGDGGDGAGDGGDGGGDGSGTPDGGTPGTGPGGEGGPGTGESVGDPHLVTFDGLDVDFQASGEFVLVRSDDGAFEIQTRQQARFANSHVTVNTAVAVVLDGSVIEVGEDRLVVDGEPRPLEPQQTITTPDGGSFSGGPGSFTFTWADGTEARYTGRSVIVRLSDDRASEVVGLLGDYDGDPANDLVDEAGELLLDDRRLTFEETYGQLAAAWQVTAASSLFTYEDGQSPETFQLDDIPGFGLYVDLLPQERREEAEEACRAAGVEDVKHLADCALDVGATGDDSFAEEAAAVEEVLVEWRTERQPTPPLVEAASIGDRAAVEQLLAAGADTEEEDSSGRTALVWATFANRPAIVADLLAAGADVDHRDGDGGTALHIAATFGLTEVAELLIDAGIDQGIEDDTGRTALDAATAQGNDDIVELLT